MTTTCSFPESHNGEWVCPQRDPVEEFVRWAGELPDTGAGIVVMAVLGGVLLALGLLGAVAAWRRA